MTPLIFQPTIAALVFWIVYVLWFGLEMAGTLDKARLGASLQSSVAEGENRDQGSRQFLVALIVIGMVAGFNLARNVPAAAIPWHPIAVFWLGIVLMLGGIVFRQMAIRTLGKYFTFTVRVRAEQPVVDFGPYRWVRHPSYTGSLLTMIGIGLALLNWASLLCIVVFAGAGFAKRIAVEERALSGALGEPYRAYMRRTWRLLPFVF